MRQTQSEKWGAREDRGGTVDGDLNLDFLGVMGREGVQPFVGLVS